MRTMRTIRNLAFLVLVATLALVHMDSAAADELCLAERISACLEDPPGWIGDCDAVCAWHAQQLPENHHCRNATTGVVRGFGSNPEAQCGEGQHQFFTDCTCLKGDLE